MRYLFLNLAFCASVALSRPRSMPLGMTMTFLTPYALSSLASSSVGAIVLSVMENTNLMSPFTVVLPSVPTNPGNLPSSR